MLSRDYRRRVPGRHYKNASAMISERANMGQRSDGTWEAAVFAVKQRRGAG
jgi:hypothetical protein